MIERLGWCPECRRIIIGEDDGTVTMCAGILSGIDSAIELPPNTQAYKVAWWNSEIEMRRWRHQCGGPTINILLGFDSRRKKWYTSRIDRYKENECVFD